MASRLLNLINDILDLVESRSPASVELEATGFDLREVIDRAMEVVEVRAQRKGLALAQEISIRACRVYLIGDPNRLRQIIINLLGNSIKFTEEGRSKFASSPIPKTAGLGCLRFAISDTGIGIPPDKLDSDLRELHAGRQLHHAKIRRHRTRSHDFQTTRGADGRAHLGGEHGRAAAARSSSPRSWRCRSAQVDGREAAWIAADLTG